MLHAAPVHGSQSQSVATPYHRWKWRKTQAANRYDCVSVPDVGLARLVRVGLQVSAVISLKRLSRSGRTCRHAVPAIAGTGHETDFYGLLGLPRFTSDSQSLLDAYEKAVSLARATGSQELLQTLDEAYRTLASLESRELYDLKLRGEDWEAPELDVKNPLGQLAEEANVLPGKQKVYLRTYGCQHNQSDGEYMLGQLKDYGYTLVDTLEECDVCVVNSCTVKTPSESRGLHLVNEATLSKKHVVLAGCVPSGDKSLTQKLPHVSMLHVTQLDHIVPVVEETSKGRTVTLLEKKESGLPSLSLPKVRQDKLTEIITINAGCLNGCTYCKTRLARGTVVSYPVDDIIRHALQAVSEGVCHIELASEDMGAYGIDIGSNIAELLLRLSDALPPGVMLRTGMTNPPHVMQHLDGVIEALQRPNVYSFMHIPVQSGSDAVLAEMKREYTTDQFLYLVGRLREAIPDIYLLTDVICGFPSETEEDWTKTMELVKRCSFHGVYSSRYFARDGTPAAKMKQLPHAVTKKRYQELHAFASANNRNEKLIGATEQVWFAGTDEARGQTIGRTKSFARVVVPRNDSLLGRSAFVHISNASVQHVEGCVIGEVI
eukprot:TRINITY_DN26585_c0_g1_i1.p1 TRINITY_DN26585_c0_g1~~TRINITY_DN26585_c0_g1_i1.p1  ORF type:complete len:603 (+),score=78.74 TRINITY_DN26585_c0_g1_i1:31-1839(+)